MPEPSLPSDLSPPDLTVREVAAYRRCSPWQVYKLIRQGVYESYLDGRVRKVIFASVLREREQVIAADRHMVAPKSPGRPPRKRPVGRPRKAKG